MLKIVPVTKLVANRFVTEHHRHNMHPGNMTTFQVGVEADGVLVGVAITSPPIARALAAKYPRSLEVRRTCTTGERNANSMLYGACARAAKALGYETLFTYTLAEEPGSSLKAAGWVVDAELSARPSWSTPSRPRYDQDLFGNARRPTGPKVRWRKDL